MAHDVRHAAWQTERRFAVRILPEDGPPADLASGLTEFLDAFDFASEWVSREDPARDGTASLAIVETQDGVAEEVWTYTPGQPAPDFSPLSWPAVPEFPSRQRKSRLRERVGTAQSWSNVRRRGAAEPSAAARVRCAAGTDAREDAEVAACAREPAAMASHLGANGLERPPVPCLPDRLRRVALVLGRPGRPALPAPAARVPARSVVAAPEPSRAGGRG